jgi:hypothetical protein
MPGKLDWGVIPERKVGEPAGACRKCGTKRVWGRNGSQAVVARCKKCLSEVNAANYLKDLANNRARSAQWHRANPEKAREQGKKWRAAHPDKVKDYHEKEYELNRESLLAAKAISRTTLNGRAQELFNNARTRSKTYNLTFSITLQWVVAALQRGHCERTRLEFVFDHKGRHAFSPSLDQKSAREGYTPANAQMVCTMYNEAKNEHDHSHVVAMARALLETNGFTISGPNLIMLSAI